MTVSGRATFFAASAMERVIAALVLPLIMLRFIKVEIRLAVRSCNIRMILDDAAQKRSPGPHEKGRTRRPALEILQCSAGPVKWAGLCYADRAGDGSSPWLSTCEIRGKPTRA